jgi:hypothetical protein
MLMHTDIPAVFYNSDTNKPFEFCISCGKELIESNSKYGVEKAVKRYPAYGSEVVLFEYAICESCAAKMRSELSKESLQKINGYFEENTNLIKRMNDFHDLDNYDVNDWLAECVVKGTRKEDTLEYQFCGQFLGDKLVFEFTPYMISLAASDEVSMLLSDKTLGELDGFIDEHFGLPPELKELLKDKPMLV